MKVGQFRITRALFAAFFYVLFASAANAAGSAALNFARDPVVTGLGFDEFSSFSGNETIGWRFTVNAPTTVFALGWWDSGSNGLGGTHQVGLWTDLGRKSANPLDPDFNILNTGSLITDVTVGAGTTETTVINSFRYHNLSSSLVLGVGSYVIGGVDTEADADTFIQSALTVSTNPLITFSGNAVRSATGSGFYFPSIVQDNFGRFGPNMLIAAAVPEPSTYALMLVGLGFVGWVARRNRKSPEVTAA